MSKINLNNYEAFVLDHLEGNLSAEDTAELKTFLVLHPELQVDLDSNDLPYLENENSSFSNKEELKKVEDEQIISYIEGLLNEEQIKAFEKKVEGDEEYRSLYNLYTGTKLLAESSVVFEGKEALMKSEQQWINNDAAFNYFENELSSAERIAFQKELLIDKKLASELSLYANTKLQADLTISYPNKEELKKEVAVIALFSTRTILSIAASILLIIGLVVIFNVYNSSPEVKQELAKNPEVAPPKKVEILQGKDNKIESPIMTNEKEAKRTFASNNSYKKNVIIKDTAKVIEGPEVEHSSLQNKKEKFIVKEEKNVPEDVKQVPDPKSPIDTVELALVNTNPEVEQSSLQGKVKNEVKNNVSEPKIKQTMLAYEADDEAEPTDEPRKNGFWQKLAKAAGQANKLGMAAVNGSENKGEGYLLSFNNVSVEKK